MKNIRNDSSSHSYVVPSFNRTNLAILYKLYLATESLFLIEDCEDNCKIVLLYNILSGLHCNKNLDHLQIFKPITKLFWTICALIMFLEGWNFWQTDTWKHDRAKSQNKLVIFPCIKKYMSVQTIQVIEDKLHNQYIK